LGGGRGRKALLFLRKKEAKKFWIFADFAWALVGRSEESGLEMAWMSACAV
jgi:hypothetical protein